MNSLIWEIFLFITIVSSIVVNLLLFSKREKIAVLGQRKVSVLSIKKILEIQTKINEINYIERINKQFCYVEDKMKEIRKIVLNYYNKIYKNYSIESPYKLRSYQALENIIDIVLVNICKELRNRFKEMLNLFNDADDFDSQARFEEYKDRITEYVVAEFNQNIRGWQLDIPHSKKEIDIATGKCFNVITTKLREILEEAYKIQLTYDKMVKHFTIELDRHCDVLTGGNDG